ncbi:uncharacterized protein LOC100376163 [Saccoglossus kowalevskii]|uniref:Tumor necrosis factor receptor superfamily member 21-like n=1 Tax=Saccoglossus kowalevskii TaxID=10224 RepID=A0ABM0M8C5_SACKO|nr:PREDICTED: tumor necrosis factor receptor superfamily member 21-like [Saccoglossus kowalevskii]
MSSLCDMLSFLASLMVLCCCLVTGNNLENVRSFDVHQTYRYQDPSTGHHRRCVKCPPGYYVQEPCFLNTNDTTCAKCPTESFMPHSSGLDKCFKCTECPDEMSAMCTATDDTQCKACQDGYYWHVHYCKQHKKCPPGRGVKQRGSRLLNTVCERCKEGTYSEELSAIQTCKLLTNCHEKGLTTLQLGSRFKDTVCVTDVTTPKSHVLPPKVNTLMYAALQNQVKTTTVKSVTAMNEIMKTKSKSESLFDANLLNGELKDYFEEDLPLDEETNRHHRDSVTTNEKDPAERPHEPRNSHDETLFNVQEIPQSIGHENTTSSGSGLAAAILGAGCLFMLVLIVVLYQRKKQVEERQRLKQKRNEIPQWQKLNKEGAGEALLSSTTEHNVQS